MLETTRYCTFTSGTGIVVEFDHTDVESGRVIYLASDTDADGNPLGQFLTVEEAQEVRRDLWRAIQHAKERR